ncbi:hypothetical protein GF327_04720 [Candidatus Woesearchaeota archaeon]|nr:hypothetical protein [Candidatus Woesearchaeota archaeon]
MEKIIKKIMSKIEKEPSDTYIEDLNDQPLKKEKFKKIPLKKDTGKSAFLDGGSSEIFKSPGISVFFNRIYYSIYENNKRVKNKKYDFFSFISAEKKKEKIIFSAELVDNEFKFPVLEFDSMDPRLKTGATRAEISKVGNIIRRLCEIHIAGKIPEKNCLVVVDGSLEIKYPYEKDFLKKTLSSGNIISGLSKTCALLSSHGDSVLASLNKLSCFDSWYYPAGKVDETETYFVKLIKDSNYIFRFDIIKSDDFGIDKIISILRKNSIDPVFLGYPYGLVEADKMARISNRESEGIKMRLLMKIQKHEKKLKPYLNCLNAHDILDNIG